MHFSNFGVQKWSCLLLSSDAFWKFSACKVYRKKFWAQFHDVCVQKRSCLLWSSDAFWKFSSCKVYTKVLGAFSRFMRPKTSCLLSSSDAVLTFSPCMLYIKFSGRIFTICASKNEANCCEVQTHFGSSLPASFAENVLGAIPRFVRPKTKLFEVKFRRILEVLRLKVL